MKDLEKKEAKIQDCDNTSVGMFIWENDKLLLIERNKFPFGFAIPAGHVDDHGSFEDAARDETKEEVGLDVVNLKLVAEGRRDNICRRPGGTWHYWKLYETEVRGNLKRSPDETKRAGWYTKDEIGKLAKKTEKFINGKITKEEWESSPGLEKNFYEWVKELKII
jgi:ADP-ribose pyrophosphatase YjhB (NUDIX family)